MIRLPHFSVPQFGWKWLAGCLLIIGVVGFKGYWWWMQRPAWIQFGSVGSQSFSVAWIGRKAGSACVTMQSFRMPFEHQRICDQTKTVTHLLQMQELQPNTVYGLYWTINGWIDPSSFRYIVTRAEAEKPRLPAPMYGSVITPDDIAVPGVLVMVWPEKIPAEYPELAITNDQGNWSTDMGVFGEGITDWVIESGSTLWNWNWQHVPSLGGLMPALEVQP